LRALRGAGALLIRNIADLARVTRVGVARAAELLAAAILRTRAAPGWATPIPYPRPRTP